MAGMASFQTEHDPENDHVCLSRVITDTSKTNLVTLGLIEIQDLERASRAAAADGHWRQH